MVTPIFFFLLIMVFSLSSFSFLLISLWKTKKKQEEHHKKLNLPNKASGFSLLSSSFSGKTHLRNQSLVVEILTSATGISKNPPSCSSKFLVSKEPIGNGVERVLEKNKNPTTETTEKTNDLELVLKVTHTHSRGNGINVDSNGDPDCEGGGDLRGGKKKKRKGKKKKQQHNGDKENQCVEEDEALLAAMAKMVAVEDKLGCTCGFDRHDLHRVECPYPFTSSSSMLQRKIKLQYDQLVKSNHAKALTLSQVGQFANCLIEAKNSLQHKSEIIQRKFTITKSLLMKADKSSFDRLCAQIYKLEMEQKRLEEDAVVYNRLQEQLKLSPAYKKMLEIGSNMELQASSEHLLESPDSEIADISFEELLAQEKKDSFWQKNGKLRSCAS